MVPLHARVHRQKSADRDTCCSLPREPNSWFSESFLHKEHEVAASGRARLSCSIQDHLLLHQGQALGHQQQLRFGSDGCLRSLKPLPPDAGLASVDGILRPVAERGKREQVLSQTRFWQYNMTISSRMVCPGKTRKMSKRTGADMPLHLSHRIPTTVKNKTSSQHQKPQVFQMSPVPKLASYISIPGSK